MFDRRRLAWRPVSSADFLRFLSRWQAVHPKTWREGQLAVSAADPLNFHGILIPDQRIPSGIGRTVPIV